MTVNPELLERTKFDFEPGTINQDINKRLQAIDMELNDVIKDRAQVIHGTLVGRVAGLHLLMKGKGGTGKSMLSREVANHISDAVHFESILDETTDPSQLFGPPNIKSMAEDGKVERVVDGMLPEATDAMLDEFFNGNIPLLHSIMSLLNERRFAQGRAVIRTPLRQALMGTNKLNLDPDLAALFDRVHLRYDVDYITERTLIKEMLAMSVTRLAQGGRGSVGGFGSHTTVTVAELDQAFQESLALDVPEDVFDLFVDILEELRGAGIHISNRRQNDGLNAVLANAWKRNHASVAPGDLDILSNMFWVTEEQVTTARGIILAAAAPGEKKALDLLDTLDELKAEVRKVEGDDEERARRVCVEQVRNAEKLQREAEAERDKVLAAGGTTQRLDEVIAKADAFKIEVGGKIFGLGAADMARMSGV